MKNRSEFYIKTQIFRFMMRFNDLFLVKTDGIYFYYSVHEKHTLFLVKQKINPFPISFLQIASVDLAKCGRLAELI